MAHIRVEAADEILGQRFKVGNNGYVRLIDYMGGDARIADVAKEYDDGLRFDSQDQTVEKMVDQRRRDVVGMTELKFHFEMPIDVALKFVYARDANVNEYSLRYSDAQDVFETLSRERLEVLLKNPNPELLERLIGEDREFAQRSFERYSRARDDGIAKELARACLGSNLNTRFYWKINLADLFDFVDSLVYDVEAGDATTKYASSILKIAKRVAPVAVSRYNYKRGWMISKQEPILETSDRRLEHEISPEAEAMLDQRIPILGNGFVELVDYMGNDFSVLNAARVSTGGDEKPRSDAENRGLINYLRRHLHTTPSEMAEFLWRVRIPLFVYRQLGRHRTFEKVVCDLDTNPDKFEFYVPKPEHINVQSTANHQGRGDEATEEAKLEFLRGLEEHHMDAIRIYRDKIVNDISPKTAKSALPVNRLIDVFLKTDLHNAMHYLGLRLDSHAQLEIREPSEAMARAVRAVAPWNYDAFETYNDHRGAITFSARELPIIASMTAGQTGTKLETILPQEWLSRKEDGTLKPNREREEFFEKLRRLGITSIQ